MLKTCDFAKKEEKYLCSCAQTPSLWKKVKMEGATAGLPTSGMAACIQHMAALLNSGDHCLFSSVFWATHSLLSIIFQWNIKHRILTLTSQKLSKLHH
jgi:O-acetylhomoserine/O-acetylserine sulfhydrylase-like pyridoxal-dependent enzyme